MCYERALESLALAVKTSSVDVTLTNVTITDNSMDRTNHLVLVDGVMLKE